eukprot:11201618-Lingulodinium_polyedra.AAC.1
MKESPANTVNMEDGSRVVSVGQAARRWLEHFQTLLRGEITEPESLTQPDVTNVVPAHELCIHLAPA